MARETLVWVGTKDGTHNIGNDVRHAFCAHLNNFSISFQAYDGGICSSKTRILGGAASCMYAEGKHFDIVCQCMDIILYMSVNE
jgi:hypothetical protein